MTLFRTVILLVLAILAIPLHAEPPAIFANLKAGKKQTVVVYGTSLTVGGAWAVATKDWFQQNYPGLVTFVNSGGSGQNSDWGVANLQKKILDLNPDLVFIEFSFNDAHEKFKMPLEKGAKNLDTIIKGIQAKNPHAAIVLMVMNVAWDAPNGNRSLSARPQLEQFNDNYRKYAKEHRLPLLDHFPNWQKLKDSDADKYHRLVPDGTHPSKEGSMEVTWPTIKAWLEQGKTEAGK